MLWQTCLLTQISWWQSCPFHKQSFFHINLILGFGWSLLRVETALAIKVLCSFPGSLFVRGPLWSFISIIERFHRSDFHPENSSFCSRFFNSESGEMCMETRTLLIFTCSSLSLPRRHLHKQRCGSFWMTFIVHTNIDIKVILIVIMMIIVI